MCRPRNPICAMVGSGVAAQEWGVGNGMTEGEGHVGGLEGLGGESSLRWWRGSLRVEGEWHAVVDRVCRCVVGVVGVQRVARVGLCWWRVYACRSRGRGVALLHN